MLVAGQREHSSEGRTGRRVGYAIAIAINVAMLVVVTNPSARDAVPFLTAAFVDVMPLLQLSLFATAVINAIYLWYDDRAFRSTTQIALAGLAIAVTLRLYDVFPFDFSSYGPLWETGIRAALILGIVGSAIAVVVELARLVTMSAPGTAPRR